MVQYELTCLWAQPVSWTRPSARGRPTGLRCKPSLHLPQERTDKFETPAKSGTGSQSNLIRKILILLYTQKLK